MPAQRANKPLRDDPARFKNSSCFLSRGRRPASLTAGASLGMQAGDARMSRLARMAIRIVRNSICLQFDLSPFACATVARKWSAPRQGLRNDVHFVLGFLPRQRWLFVP